MGGVEPAGPNTPGTIVPRVGISACLLGAAVRYDGGDKRDQLCLEVLGPHVTWVPICPEVEVGMGVPRESVRLVAQPGRVHLRMLGNQRGTDWTARMNRYAAARVRALAPLDGYVWKARSPSCGLRGVKIHEGQAADAPVREGARGGTGLFAAAVMRRFPGLPALEEGELADPARARWFWEQIVARARARHL